MKKHVRLSIFTLLVCAFFISQLTELTEVSAFQTEVELPQKLYMENGAPFDQFGKSVDSDGEHLAVASRGLINVYEQDDEGWQLSSQLLASNADFPAPISISGNLIAGGAPLDIVDKNSSQGRVYVFEKQGGTWELDSFFSPESDRGGLRFGNSVDLQGDDLVVSADGASTDEVSGHGAVYVYRRIDGEWVEQQRLVPPELQRFERFGYVVRIFGDRIAVGAPTSDFNQIQDIGTVYTFIRSGDEWVFEQQFNPEDGLANDRFGGSLTLSDEWLAVGSEGHDAFGINSGAAYMYRFSKGTWTQSQKLSTSITGTNQRFGNSLSIEGEYLAVGAWQDSEVEYTGGKAYVFKNNEGAWNIASEFAAFDLENQDYFGKSVVLKNRDLFVSSNAEINDNQYQGAVYSYVRPIGRTDLISDTGSVSDDEITNATDLQFSVSGYSEGSTVQLVRGGVVVDSKVGEGTSLMLADKNAPENNAQEYGAVEVIDGVRSTPIPLTVKVDRTAPIVKIDLAPNQSPTTNQSSVEFLLTSDEPITELTPADFSLSASTANVGFAVLDLTSEGNGKLVRISNIQGNGTVVLELTGTVRDIAGNLAAPTAVRDTIVRDIIRPDVIVNQAKNQSDPTTNGRLEYDVVFSEEIFSFDSSDLRFSISDRPWNSTVSNITIKRVGEVYKVAFNASSDGGEVRMWVIHNSVTDAAGNPNNHSQSTDNSVVLDNIGPLARIFLPEGQTTITSRVPLRFSLLFSEEPIGFEESRISISSDTADVSSAQIITEKVPNGYEVKVFGVSGSGRVFLHFDEDGITDELGNPARPTWKPANFVWFVEKKETFDFDGDSKADISVFRPSLGEFWYLRSSDGNDGAFSFGTQEDIPVPGDFTGDGIADFAFWRPSTGEWFVLRSDNTGFFSFPFGAEGDIPAPGNFDGDRVTDAALFRPSTGTWYILRTIDSQTEFAYLGGPGDRPLVGDYDGDARDDVAVYKPDVAQFWQLRSTQGLRAFAFGVPNDIALAADISGDGTDDMVQFRPSTGFWNVLRSEDDGFFGFPFGTTGDMPAAADYDGDGAADPTVFRPSDTTWYSLQSTNGATFTTFGATGDLPLPGAYNSR